MYIDIQLINSINCEQSNKIKIPMVALFPNTPAFKKNKFGTEALNENNLVCKAIKRY